MREETPAFLCAVWSWDARGGGGGGLREIEAALDETDETETDSDKGSCSGGITLESGIGCMRGLARRFAGEGAREDGRMGGGGGGRLVAAFRSEPDETGRSEGLRGIEESWSPSAGE